MAMEYNEKLYRTERHWKEGEFDVFRPAAG